MYNKVIFTAVIKGAEGYVAGALVMVTGYFIVQVFMYGFEAEISEGLFNLV